MDDDADDATHDNRCSNANAQREHDAQHQGGEA